MTRLRLAVAGAAFVAAGAAPFATPANADHFCNNPKTQLLCTVERMICRAAQVPPPEFQFACPTS